MGDDIDIATLRSLVTEEKWNDILRLTLTSSAQPIPPPGQHFFRGLAYLRTGHITAAIDSINSGLAQNPTSDWGNQLCFEAHLAAGDVTTAFQRFREFIESTTGREPQKAWYVQKASEMGLFQIAGEMNETRDVITTVKKRPRYALALQCFSKVDTLSQTFNTLSTLHNAKDYGLVIIVDSCNESGLESKYAQGNQQVRKLIAAEVPKLLDSFFSVEILQNERNLGTAPTCRRLLDHVTNTYAGFLFIEDDCLLAPSALDWTRHHLSTSVSILGPWFLSCESIFFDRQGRTLSTPQYNQLLQFASQPWICAAYHMLDFVPSTCFGTTSEIWRICSSIRSFTRGPESLSRFMVSLGRKTVSPVVPRASDIGMMHELGYSVTLMGREHVRETKNTILMADGHFDASNSKLFSGNIDLLYSATSLLNTEHLLKCKEAGANGAA